MGKTLKTEQPHKTTNTAHETDTSFILAMRYRKPVVMLSQVVTDYLPHMDIATASRQASACKLPFPAFRPAGSKSQWMVNVSDIALWLDKEHEKAANDWHAVND